MMRWKRAALLAFFVALAALQVLHGLQRLEGIRQARLVELREEIARAHLALAQDLRARLERHRTHASYLARLPAARELARASSEEAAGRLRAELEAYLETFGDVGWVSVLDEQGGALLRVPSGRYEVESGGAWRARMAALGAACPAGEVAVGAPREDGLLEHVSPLEVDQQRVGLVVVAARVEPLLDAVRGFGPLPGGESFLFGEEGGYLAHDVPAKERGGRAPTGLQAEHPDAAAELLAGAASARTPEALFLALPVSEQPPLRLGLRLPDDSLEAAVFPQRGDYVRTLALTVGATLLLAGAWVFFRGLLERDERLREAERYLERLSAEWRRYRALLEGAADMILIVDPRTRAVREASGAAREVLGLSKVAGGAPLDALVDGADREALARAIDHAVQRKGESLELAGLRLRGAAGTLLADGRLAALDLEGGPVVQLALRDVTRQREVERQLARTERLGALGLLTAGVAHEINNPLEGIGNYLTLLEREGLPEERRRRYLEQVSHGFQRIRDIVRGLLDFVRPGVQRGSADLGEIARHALELVGLAGEMRGVQVALDGLEPGAHVVEGDPGRLEQVLINLLLNAAQAMGGQGRVRVAARRDEAAGEVELVVEDEGPGIPPERLAHLFDPFYSADGAGAPRGTGLGLSISFGIVRAHGGTLTAENRPEGGARFTVRLPAHAGEALEAGGRA